MTLRVGVLLAAVAVFTACTGSKGDRGATGPAGAPGPTGHAGAAGPGGPSGPAGETGPSPTYVVEVEDGGAVAVDGGVIVVQGPQGAPGTAVTVSPLASGDANCPTGGVAVTSAGGTTYVCSGAPGAQGPAGPTGPSGATILGPLDAGAVPHWDGTLLTQGSLWDTGSRVGVNVLTPSGELEVSGAAVIGVPVDSTGRLCALNRSTQWTDRASSAAACTSYCTAAGYAQGRVTSSGPSVCSGPTCLYISDFSTCTTASIPNNGACDSCSGFFTCLCQVLGSSFSNDVKVGGYLQLGTVNGTPPAADCSSATLGKSKVDPATGQLWICVNSGWIAK